MQMARWACGEADKSEIDLVSVENAISLVEFQDNRHKSTGHYPRAVAVGTAKSRDVVGSTR